MGCMYVSNEYINPAPIPDPPFSRSQHTGRMGLSIVNLRVN